MKKIFILAFIALANFGCASSDKSSTSEVKKQQREDFYIESQFRVSELSKDGKTAYTAFYGSQLWFYNIDTKESGTLYDFKNSIKAWDSRDYITSIESLNDGTGLIIGVEHRGKNSDKGSFEIVHFDLSKKQIKVLLQAEAFDLDVCNLSPDGSKLSYRLKTKDRFRAELYALNIDVTKPASAQNPVLIIDNGSIIDCGYFSADNKNYFLYQYVTNSTSEIIKVNLLTKQHAVITPSGKFDFNPLSISTSDNRLYAESNFLSDFHNIYRYDEEKKSFVQKTFENWDVLQLVNADKHKLFFYIVDYDGFRKLKIANSDFKVIQEVKLDFDLFGIVGIDDSQENFLLRAAKSPFPRELFHYNWKTGKLVQVTNFNKLKVSDATLSKPELVNLKSSDGVGFSSWLLKPKPHLDNGIAIIDVHGGPESNVSQEYSEDNQYLVNQGFTVLQPNFRGSLGFGTKFQRKIYRDWGGSHMLDLMASRDYLIKQLKISENKVAIIGGSFGGYSSAAAVVQHPNAFCAASTEYAVLDVVKHIQDSNAIYAKSQTETIGDLKTDLVRLNKISPMNNIDRIKTPMLIVYGEEDKVVSSGQSELFIKKMTQKKKNFETIVYDNEGHGVSGFSNFQFYQKELVNFLTKNCK